jgi:hypothetical protein
LTQLSLLISSHLLPQLTDILSAVTVDKAQLTYILSADRADTAQLTEILSAVTVDKAQLTDILSADRVDTAQLTDILSSDTVDTAKLTDISAVTVDTAQLGCPAKLILIRNNRNWNRNWFRNYPKQDVCFGCFSSISKQGVSVFRLNRNKKKTTETNRKKF